jgi:DNA-binding GntR family transcriptional regulator
VATNTAQPLDGVYTTLRDVALKAIRGLIADGTLRPGVRVFEEDLAERLGVSRGPVREALRRFEEQGVIVSYPNRGSFMVELTAEEIQQLYELRAALEAMAVRTVMGRKRPEELRQLSARLTQMRKAAGAKDLRRLLEADLAFHRVLWQAAGNRFLLKTLASLDAQIQVLMSVENRTYGDLGETIKDHEALLQVIRRRDPEVAADVMTRHVLDAGLRTIAAVEAAGSSSAPLAQTRRRGAADRRSAPRAAQDFARVGKELVF